MQSQVLKAVDLTLVDPSFIALDATPVKANVSNNNPTTPFVTHTTVIALLP